MVEPNRTKYDNGLFQIARAVRAVRERGWGLNAIATQAVSAEVAGLVREQQARFTGNNVQVYVEWTSPASRDLAAVRRAGANVEIEDTARAITQVNVPIATLDQLEALPNVKRVRLPDYPVRNVGSQLTEGDGLLRFSNLRTLAGVDGTGVKVGVISDGIGGLQAAIGLGDLPASAETRNGSAVLTATSGGVIAQSFRADSNLEAGSEGTAMLEIVHDIAPGAQLYFANFNTALEFNAAVNHLASVADVVVDDIGWLGMPIDGTSLVSANTSAALNNNANPIRVYATSVGNQALRHYRDPYLNSGVDITARATGTTAGGASFSGSMTLFRATSNTSDQGAGASSINNAIRVPNGGTATVELQWDDTWGASANDYNLAVTWTNGGFYNLIASSTFVQNGDDDPLERVSFTNTTGSTQIYDIRVWNQGNAAAVKNLNIMVAGSVDTVTDFTSSNLLWLTPGSSLLAQSDAGGGVISVGAIAALDPGTDSIEGYSSNGPTLDGRIKPDVTAIDGVGVTGSGGFFNPFYGTSAAAPHVAGMAVLLLDVHERWKSTDPNALAAATARTQVRSMIVDTAIDLGTAGVDNVYGSGRVDGVTAFAATGPASQLAFTAAPAIAVTGSVQPQPVGNALFYTQPVVEIQDAVGHVAATATDTITISIKAGTGAVDATLLGTTSRAAVAGVATFTDLKIDRPGTGYILVASAAGLTLGESAPFDVGLSVTNNSLSAVGVGSEHSCAVTGAGGVVCWGNNGDGELGNGASGLSNASAAPAVGVSNITSVVGGQGFTCALSSGGGVKCWGRNDQGQLGRGTTTASEPVPDDVTGLTSNVTAISAGSGHACALKTDLTVWCWGRNLSEQLGTNAVSESNVPLQASTGKTAIAAGGNRTCALAAQVSCWGSGGSTTASNTAGATALAVGSTHGCAIMADTSVRCWGANESGQLGDGTTTASTDGVAVPGLAGVTSLAVGTAFSCARTSAGAALCWGANANGELGRGSFTASETSVAVVSGLASGVTSLAAANSQNHACALQSGTVKCWGAGNNNRLGNGSSSNAATPVTLSLPQTALAFTTQPAGAVAGANLTTQPVVAIRDADGNVLPGVSGSVTIAIKSGTGAGGAVLQGTATVALVAGVATFTDLRIDQAAAGYVLVASMSGATSAESSAFTISAGAANKIAFATSPGGAVTGAFTGAVPAATFTTQPVILVQDAFGNTVTGSTHFVLMRIKSGTGNPAATLQGSLTVAANAGVATFTNLRIDKPGTGYVLQAQVASLANPFAESDPFDVAAGAAHHLTVTTHPGNATGGSAFGFQPVIEVRDGDQNVITSSSAAITASLKSGTGTSGAVLSGTTSVAAVAGVATFTDLKIDRTGTGYVLVFASSGLTSVESAAFNVTAGAPATVEVTTPPAGAVTGGAVFTTQPVVRLLDAGGNVASGATNAVTLAIKPGTGTGGASLLGTNPVNAVAGVATFTDLRINRPGTGYVLVASVGGLTDAESAAFNVTQGAAASLNVTTPPAGATAGSAFTTQPVVQVLDGDGNVVTGSAASVQAVIRGGTGTFGASLSGTTTATASNGVATFANLAINRSGTGYQLTFYTGGLSAHSAAFNVAAGVASKLVIARQPSGAIAGAALTGQPIVHVTDAAGNVIAGAGTPITLAIAPATGTTGAVLGGTTTVNTDASGVATFTDLTIDLAGTGYVLAATSGVLTGASSDGFSVRPAAVAIQTAPVPGDGGALFATPPAVKIQNAGGDVNEHVFFHAAIKAGTGTPGAQLLGTTTVEALNGTATFTDLRIDKAGTGYVIVFSVSTSSTPNSITSGAGPVAVTAAAGDDAAPVQTPPFNVQPGAAVGLAFTTSPGSTTPGSLFTPQPLVSVVDAGGNPVPSATNAITVAITGGTGTGGATLAGTTSIAAVNGTSTYFDLAIDLAGQAYTLTASAGGLGTAVSTAFNVALPAVVSSGGGGGGGGGRGGPAISVGPSGGSVATLPPASAEVDLSRPSTINATIAAFAPGGTEGVTSTTRLSIPAAAMPGIATVWVRPVATVAELERIAPAPAGTTLLTAVLIGSFGAGEEPLELKQFDKPVELTITVPAGALPEGEDGSKLVISYWNGTSWEDQVTKSRKDGGSVILTTELSHFSTYGVLFNGGGAPPRPAPSVGSGTFSGRPIFSESGQAFVVYGGGSSAQLEAAAKAAGATGVWAQDAGGTFRLLVVGGPAFLRAEFDAAFPAGFTSTSAMTLVR
ncbi:MAG: hypothetical protein AB7G21_09245 [Dehalococcoidia bacterium]